MPVHRRGEKAKLLSTVEELCIALGRPICSADLHAFFRNYPDRRPCLLKRIGQQLIGAAQPNDGYVPYLRKIGVFRYKAFYALENNSLRQQQFADYCAREKAIELRSWKIPEHVVVLQETGHVALARHAASGWIAEIEQLADCHSEPESIRELFPLARDMEITHPWNAAQLVKSDFIGRDGAWNFLCSQAALRRLWDAPLSPTRHLVRFRWPQSLLFPALGNYLLMREQLEYFVRGKWPLDGEDAQMHAALAACLRYGKPDCDRGAGRLVNS